MLHYKMAKDAILDGVTMPELELMLKVVRNNQDSDLRLLALAIHDTAGLYKAITGDSKPDEPRSALKKFADGLARMVNIRAEADPSMDKDLARKIELRTKAYELSQRLKDGG